MTADQLKKHLEKRATEEELRQRHILPENPNLSPALAAHQKELERSMIEDQLKGKLEHRPAPEEVIEKGILTRKLAHSGIEGNGLIRSSG